MKRKINLLPPGFIALIGLAGRASTGSSNTRSLLAAAGFRRVMPPP